MKWIITGADRDTGADVRLEIDADDETAAIKQAGKTVYIESVKPTAGAPPTPVIPKPSATVSAKESGARRFFFGDLSWKRTVTVTAAIVGTLFIFGWWSYMRSTRLTTAHVLDGLVEVFTINVMDEKRLDETVVRAAVSDDRQLGLRIDAKGEEVQYAHIAAPGWVDGRRVPDDDRRERYRHSTLMEKFLHNTDRRASQIDLNAWLGAAYREARNAPNKSAFRTASDREILVEYDIEADRYKLAVRAID